MSGPLVILGVLAGVLLAIQMLKPRFIAHAISAARFFADLPPPKSQSRLAVRPPWPTRAFWLRLAAWGAALAAMLATDRVELAPRPVERLGVWLLLDTSASLTAQAGAGTRWDEVRAAAESWLDRLPATYPAARIEWRLSAFDEVRRDLAVDTGRAGALRAALRELSPRLLGTQIGLVAAAAGAPPPFESGHGITHLVVISDLPRPPALADMPIPVVWHEVGETAGNTGIVALSALRDPFSGAVARVRIALQQSGSPASPPQSLRVRAPGAAEETEVGPLAWRADGFAEVEVPVGPSGVYQARLDGGGACRFDDAVAWRLPVPQPVRVDWQAPGAEWVARLGWTPARGSEADLRVLAHPAAGPLPADGVPTLLLAPARKSAGPQRLDGFIEGHALLADVNLDALERDGPAPVELDAGWDVVARAGQGRGWAAWRERPRACLVPEPPAVGAPDEAGTRLRHTLFFNALRHLVVTRPPPPLYTPTTVAEPAPDLAQARLALLPDESLTGKLAAPAGAEPFVPTAARVVREREARWPVWVAVAALAAALEGLLALGGGTRWS